MFILPGALAPMASYRQFILVQFIPAVSPLGVAIPGKTVKHPIDPRNLKLHNAHDPAIWMTCAEASALAAAMGPGWGVGFVITAADPFGCMDMDNCATPEGGWTPAALSMLGALPGAIELSNSGRGLHVWFMYQGVAPEHGCKSAGWLELYTQERFIALGSSASGAMVDVTAMLPAFIATHFPPDDLDGDAEGWTTTHVAEHTPLSDDDLMRMALSSTRKQSAETMFAAGAPLPCFADLWNRDMRVLPLAFPPDGPGKEFANSEADFALAKDLAYWTGKNCERIEAFMRKSSLARDKWDTRRRDTTYLGKTILRAVAAQTTVYKVRALMSEPPKAGVKLVARAITHATTLGRETMAALFEECVYVQDANSVLLPNGDMIDQARFKVRYGGRSFVMGNDNEKTSNDAWDAFINNKVIEFPRVDGSAFDPTLEFQEVIERGGRAWVNIYKAPVVSRVAGDVGPFLSLLSKLLPRGDDALILLSYLAAVVQYRGIKFRWAPFIQGTPGNGKSTIVNCLKYALGDKYIFSVKAGMIENNFNAWLEKNVLYVADDIYSSKDRTDMMEALKSMITEVDHGVTYKGIDSMQKRICGNFIFTDNHKDAMQKRDDSRRVCTLYCAQQSPADRRRDGLTKEFFAKTFMPWLKNGGFSHVAELLSTMEIDARYNPAGECQEAPETSVTAEAIVDGRTGIEHEVAEWIDLEEPGFCGDFVSYHMLRERMRAMPQYAKSAGPLKIKEMLGRLGYEIHPALGPTGRAIQEVAPDQTRPILYVKRETWRAAITDPVAVGLNYQLAQQSAITAAVQRRFQTNGGV